MSTKICMLNFRRFEALCFIKRVLKSFCRNQNIKISSSLYEPFREMGVVSLEADAGIVFTDMKWLTRILEFSDNLHVYPLENGKTHIDFTLYGMTEEFIIEEEL